MTDACICGEFRARRGADPARDSAVVSGMSARDHRGHLCFLGSRTNGLGVFVMPCPLCVKATKSITLRVLSDLFFLKRDAHILFR